MSEVTLNQDSFDTTVLQSKKLVFIDFWAPWCGPCRVMGPIIEELAGEMPDVLVAKVNVDDEPDLAQQYNILSIPTFMMFKGGQVVDQFSGTMNKETLRSRIASRL
ncbi:MAG: Thioredoxin [Candidatus Uhrbacteria bacterium GW2011_GWA2_53_10]|uniref:Thioredoxin n=1 Tax=Candidatus Uhrbacteria bacterium GW2011_GWA2_53_10 TaxID=1618980 RepID=A0A0G1XN70_9BACT|nr:MAG: Thioredoxin [Candidatus Uhrbacteria bacterium GW2011_GWA2_53_10]